MTRAPINDRQGRCEESAEEGVLKLQRYDAICQRVLRDGEIVAMVLQLANGNWALFDTSEQRLHSIKASFESPRKAFAAYRLMKFDVARAQSGAAS